MRLILVRCFALLGLLAAIIPTAWARVAKDKANSAEEVVKKLQGDWKGEKGVSRGEAIPAEFVAKILFTFKGNEIIPADMPKDIATFKLDPAQRPATIDLTDRSKETLLGIYELKGNVLKLCIAENPKDPRPKDFTSTKENKLTVLELKRVNK